MTMSDSLATKPARRPARGTPALALLGAFLAGLAGGCGDEMQEPAATRSAAGEIAPHKIQWLDVASPVTPAQWLASREEAQARPLSDPEVQRVDRQLKLAHTRYRESERMIANRAAQLSDMLKQIGIAERATDVLDDLASIGGEVGQTEGFGSISQYYFNLRAANTPRAEALATLKTRYGPKS